MAKLITPDFDLPLSVGATGEFAEVEQDSTVDYQCKAEVLLRYRTGQRAELPEFGSPDLLGAVVPIDLTELRQSFAAWIPEANYRLTAGAIDPNDPSLAPVTVEVDQPSVEE